MHVISQKALAAFWIEHSAAESSLRVWHRIINSSAFASFIEIKQAFNSADYAAPYTIFDISGNNFRIITVIHYNRQKLYIREVLTHKEYDRWMKEYRSKKS